MGIISKIKKKASSVYKKADTALGGYLPGGQTPREVKQKKAMTPAPVRGKKKLGPFVPPTQGPVQPGKKLPSAPGQAPRPKSSGLLRANEVVRDPEKAAEMKSRGVGVTPEEQARLDAGKTPGGTIVSAGGDGGGKKDGGITLSSGQFLTTAELEAKAAEGKGQSVGSELLGAAGTAFAAHGGGLISAGGGIVASLAGKVGAKPLTVAGKSVAKLGGFGQKYLTTADEFISPLVGKIAAGKAPRHPALYTKGEKIVNFGYKLNSKTARLAKNTLKAITKGKSAPLIIIGGIVSALGIAGSGAYLATQTQDDLTDGVGSIKFTLSEAYRDGDYEGVEYLGQIADDLQESMEQYKGIRMFDALGAGKLNEEINMKMINFMRDTAKRKQEEMKNPPPDPFQEKIAKSREETLAFDVERDRLKQERFLASRAESDKFRSDKSIATKGQNQIRFDAAERQKEMEDIWAANKAKPSYSAYTKAKASGQFKGSYEDFKRSKLNFGLLK